MNNSNIDNVAYKVNRIVAEQAGIHREDIEANKSLSSYMDSLDTVEVVMALEDEFALKISDEDAKVLNTPAEIIVYVEERLTRE